MSFGDSNRSRPSPPPLFAPPPGLSLPSGGTHAPLHRGPLMTQKPPNAATERQESLFPATFGGGQPLMQGGAGGIFGGGGGLIRFHPGPAHSQSQPPGIMAAGVASL